MRVLLVHTGGTLMMQATGTGPLAPGRYAADLLGELPVLRKIADVETRILYQLDSSDIQPEHWVEVARTVHGALDDYDGVVVVHGTDTMAYTASALAFLLPELDRPVVLTGSQRPLEAVRSDARQNLVDAFELATSRIPEVGLCFASKMLRGCRATKLDAWALDAFGSPSSPPLVKLGLGMEVAPHVLPPRARTSPFDGRIDPHVLEVRLFPGLDPRLLRGALTAGVHGLVVSAFGSGNVPALERSIIPVLDSARGMDIPVVVVSQCPRAHVDLLRYEGGARAAEAGAIGAGDMTAEAALTKLMVALGRADEGGRVRSARRAFEHAWVGEMSENVPRLPAAGARLP
ncbi:MAG: asparaginase [Polyangiaceae bacterium]|nr:asparaginase [Polyangiaceae bacterium]